MSRARLSARKKVVGNLSHLHAGLIMMILTVVVVIAVVFARMEYSFFTDGDVIRHFEIDPVFIFQQFGNLCVMMFTLVSVIVAMPVLISYFMTGMSKQTVLMMGTAIIGVMLWMMVEDAMANWFYTQGDLNPVGWNDQLGAIVIHAPIKLGAYWVPYWMIIFSVVIAIISALMVTYQHKTKAPARRA